MSGVQPYDGWLFFAADDVDEVNRIYAALGTDETGWQRWPAPDDFVDTVRVIAVEQERSVPYVWVLRDGQAERHESWQVREANVYKLAEPAA